MSGLINVYFMLTPAFMLGCEVHQNTRALAQKPNHYFIAFTRERVYYLILSCSSLNPENPDSRQKSTPKPSIHCQNPVNYRLNHNLRIFLHYS
jgi:hypothetical protein